MNWRDFGGAPDRGAPLVEAAALPPGAALGLVVGDFPVVVVRAAAGLRAYVNACPHQYLPLDHRGGRILSADGRSLLCANHGAAFDAATGEGVAGPGLGCALIPVPVAERDGWIVIDG